MEKEERLEMWKAKDNKGEERRKKRREEGRNGKIVTSRRNKTV